MGLGDLVGGLLGSSSAQRSSAAAQREANRLQREQMKLIKERIEKAIAILEEVGVPSIEAQQIVLSNPESIPELVSEFTGLELDPELIDEQMDSIIELREISDVGETKGERAQRRLSNRQTGAKRQADIKSTLQNMAQRGISGSGVELASLIGSNAAANAAREVAGLEAQKMREARAMQAIQAKSSAASQLAQQKFGAGAQRAQALDAASKFNLANQWERNKILANLANQQEIHNKGLIQQDFLNKFNLAKEKAGAHTRGAQLENEAYNQALETQKAIMDAAQKKNQSAMGAAMKIGGAALGYYFGGPAGGAVGAQAGEKLAEGTEKQDGGVVDSYNNGGVMNDNWIKDLFDQESADEFDGNRYTNSAEDGSLFAGGGIPVPGAPPENDLISGDVVPGNNFEGDRVDAKINSGEMVLNLPQQQRLMELLKGYRSLADLGDENIVQSPEGLGPDVPVPGGVPGGDPSLGLPEGDLAGAVGPIPPGAEGLPSLGDEGLPPGIPARDGRTIYAQDGWLQNYRDLIDKYSPARKRFKAEVGRSYGDYGQESSQNIKEELLKKSVLNKLFSDNEEDIDFERYYEGGLVAPQYNDGGLGDFSEERDHINDFNSSNESNEPEWKRGLLAKHSRLVQDEDEDKEKRKHRNAHIKALEVLTGTKKDKEIPPLG